MNDVVLSNRFKFSVETDHYQSMAFGPGVKNIWLQFNFNTGPHDSDHANYLKHFTAGVFNIAEGEESVGSAVYGNSIGIVGVRCSPNSVDICNMDDTLAISVRQQKLFDGLDARKPHEFKMAVWDGRVEIEIDERPVFYGPMTRNIERLGIVMKAVGADFQITNLQAYELMDEPEKSALLKRDINKQYRHKYTRIHYAAQKWDLDSTKNLLEFNPDLTLRNEFGEQPLHSAIRGGIKGAPEALLEKGAKLDITSAAALGRKDELKEMLATQPKPNVNAVQCQWAPMHGAAISNDPDIIKMLVDAGADINARTSPRLGAQTPLIWAVLFNGNETVKALLARGADVNVGDVRKFTALYYAEHYNMDAIAKMLKDKNAPRTATEAVRPPGPPPGDF